ncbi:MAG: hypothetical protein KG028_15335 [Actinobacteria bacterium]|jgi:uncharacterized membrane protein|nr:hypothetical protein [Actinomycetota bacterium]
MTPTSKTHDLARQYLARLDAATSDLPADVRADLRADIEAHLDEVLAVDPGEASFREALDRLGSPETVALAARASLPSTDGVSGVSHLPPTASPTSTSARDVTTVVMLLLLPATLGLLLSYVGVALGIAVAWGLLWSSRTWTSGEKLLGTLVWPGGLITPLLLGLVGGETCSYATVTDDAGRILEVTEQVCEGFSLPLWLGIPALIVAVVAPLLVGALLLHRSAKRR